MRRGIPAAGRPNMKLVTLFSCLVLGCAALMLGGCVEETPELEPLELSTSEVQRGETVTGTAMVEDDNGDLDGGKITITIRSADGDGRVLAAQDLPIAFGDRTRRASIGFSFRIEPTATRGPTLVELVIVDKAGHASQPQTAPLLVK
jgi:hypothetical protein